MTYTHIDYANFMTDVPWTSLSLLGGISGEIKCKRVSGIVYIHFFPVIGSTAGEYHVATLEPGFRPSINMLWAGQSNTLNGRVQVFSNGAMYAQKSTDTAVRQYFSYPAEQ